MAYKYLTENDINYIRSSLDAGYTLDEIYAAFQKKRDSQHKRWFTKRSGFRTELYRLAPDCKRTKVASADDIQKRRERLRIYNTNFVRQKRDAAALKRLCIQCRSARMYYAEDSEKGRCYECLAADFFRSQDNKMRDTPVAERVYRSLRWPLPNELPPPCRSAAAVTA